MMKKRFGAFVAMVLVFTMMFSMTVSAAGTNTVTYTQANEIATICYQGYNGGVKGPIIITQGTLHTWFSDKEVYLVTLSGTEMVTQQSTGYFTDLLAGFNQNNAYLYNVIRTITMNIPKGSNLILAGHSLGGMIAQQTAASSYMKENYNILNTVTFGSPLIAAGEREGDVKRLGDTSDVVPYLSVTGSIEKEVWKVCGLQRENGGYGTDCLSAHTDSYLRSDLWGKYDVVGSWWGTAELTLDLDTQQYFKAPNIV